MGWTLKIATKHEELRLDAIQTVATCDTKSFGHGSKHVAAGPGPSIDSKYVTVKYVTSKAVDS